MRTIEEPLAPEEETRSYHIRCQTPKCAALLEVHHSELKFFRDWRDGDYFHFRCPHCGRSTNINADVLPSFIYPVEKSSLIEEADELVQEMNRLMNK